jgi:hypothetical protein
MYISTAHLRIHFDTFFFASPYPYAMTNDQNVTGTERQRLIEKYTLIGKQITCKQPSSMKYDDLIQDSTPRDYP